MARDKGNETTHDQAGTEDLKHKLAAALSGHSHDGDRAGESGSGAGQDGNGSIQPASDDVHGNVLQEIEAATGIEKEEIVDDKALGDDIGVDSLSLVDLSVRLEERFGVELSDDDVSDSTTVRDLVNLVQRKLDAK